MAKKSRDNTKHKQPPNNFGALAKPPQEAMIKIPSPLPIQIESSTEDNKRYTEQKESRDAQLGAAQRLNNITKFGAIIAFASLVALYISILQSRNTFEMGERAWVMIDKAELAHDLSASEAVQIFLSIKNVGQSPALSITSKSDMIFAGIGCRANINRSPYDSYTNLGPGQINGFASLSIGPLETPCLNSLQNGNATFTLRGVVTYNDIFRKQRTTTYCYQYEGTTTHALTACPQGNDVK